MQKFNDFIDTIRAYLIPGTDQMVESDNYINLADICFEDNVPEIHMLGYPKYNPFLSVFEIILEQISAYNVDRVKAAINELLKFYLAKLDKDVDLPCRELMYRLELIFERCLHTDFPYTDKLWDFLNRSLQNFCMYLLLSQRYDEAKEALETLAHLGRNAAQEGLPTAVTQSALRLVETKARELAQENLADLAKNHRFNLEI